MFACAHPAIEAAVRAPLILQVLLGLDAVMIASAFLTSPAAMSQRLVRAKDKIRKAGIPFRIPEREELSNRLGTVLDAIYAAFSEGWADSGGTDVARRDLAEEALFLGQLVTQLLPEEPEALGLLALMLYIEARRPARRNAQGEYVPLAEQDIALWNREMIESAEVLLLRASPMSSIGRYQLEAALQSAHVARRRTGAANWSSIVQLYDALLALSGSPVVAINRAPGHCRGGRSACGAGNPPGPCPGRAPDGIPTLLGRPRRVTCQEPRARRSTPSLRGGDRPRARSRGTPFPAATAVRPGVRLKSQPVADAGWQKRLVSPAEGQCLAIAQHELVVTVKHRAQLCNETHPHDVRSMHA
jgi:uncharacterized protein DUF6596